MDELDTQLGAIEGRPYFLRVVARPSVNDVLDFAAVLYYSDEESDDRAQVARIDTSHGYTHIDKLYSERQESEPLDVNVWEAHEHLEANWVRYARIYRENHE